MLFNFSRISGYASRIDHTAGRPTAAGLQYIWVNKRPVDMPKITKAINQMYRWHGNVKAYPMLFINIEMPTEYVDINVQPDKRQVLLQQEGMVLRQLQYYLGKTWAPNSRRYFPTPLMDEEDLLPGDKLMNKQEIAAEIAAAKSQQKKTPVVQTQELQVSDDEFNDDPETEKKKKEILSITSAVDLFGDDEDPAGKSSSSSSSTTTTTTTNSQNRSDTSTYPTTSTSGKSDQGTENSENRYGKTILKKLKREASEPAITQFFPKITFDVEPQSEELPSLSEDTDHEILTQLSQKCPSSPVSSPTRSPTRSPTKSLGKSLSRPALISSEKNQQDKDARTSLLEQFKLKRKPTEITDKSADSEAASAEEKSDSGISDVSASGGSLNSTSSEKYPDLPQKIVVSDGDETIMKKLFNLDTKNQANNENKDIVMEFNMSDYKRYHSEFVKQKKKDDENLLQKMKKMDEDRLKFQTYMGKSSAADIETELSRKITKDQHASDEKFNYEDLRANTQLQIQKLLKPMSLNLSPTDEMVLMDNIDIFKKNGFDFEINPDAPSTQRVLMTSYPFSKGAQFGLRDIQELIFLINESPQGTVVRLARVASVFATRACHKSVTIGTALNKSKMTQIIRNMGTMTNPWSCPHGRPTIRHLFDLNSISFVVKNNKEKKSKILQKKIINNIGVEVNKKEGKGKGKGKGKEKGKEVGKEVDEDMPLDDNMKEEEDWESEVKVQFEKEEKSSNDKNGPVPDLSDPKKKIPKQTLKLFPPPKKTPSVGILQLSKNSPKKSVTDKKKDTSQTTADEDSGSEPNVPKSSKYVTDDEFDADADGFNEMDIVLSDEEDNSKSHTHHHHHHHHHHHQHRLKLNSSKVTTKLGISGRTASITDIRMMPTKFKKLAQNLAKDPKLMPSSFPVASQEDDEDFSTPPSSQNATSTPLTLSLASSNLDKLSLKRPRSEPDTQRSRVVQTTLSSMITLQKNVPTKTQGNSVALKPPSSQTKVKSGKHKLDVSFMDEDEDEEDIFSSPPAKKQKR